MSDPTVPFILNVPVLDDEAVDAVNTFLRDLLVQFENQYFSQLQRHHRKLDALRRDPLEPWKNRAPDLPDPQGDEDFNDENPF